MKTAVALAVVLLQFKLSFAIYIPKAERSWAPPDEAEQQKPEPDDSGFKLFLTPVEDIAPNVDETVDNKIEQPTIDYDIHKSELESELPTNPPTEYDDIVKYNLQLKLEEELKEELKENNNDDGEYNLYQLRMHENIVEGDIALTPEQMAIFNESGWDGLLNSEAWSPNSDTWERRIPYVCNSNLDSDVQSGLTLSINLYHQHTCLRFESKRSYDSTYMYFTSGRGCYTRIGKPSSGARTIVIGRGCTRAVAAHEIFHALGRNHEQSRPDRDTYVTIHPENFNSNPSTPYQFRSISNADTQNLPYDYDSVMHYSARAFQRAAGLYTITPNDPSVAYSRLGQRSGLSENDIQHVNIRYCPDRVIRLVGGRGSYEGRVEVFYDEQWGTVCDDYFDMNDANVICKYLGFPGAEVAYSRAHFGQGSGQIWMDDLQCDGNEYSPFSCDQNSFGQHNCQHSEDAGVRCSKNVRLIGGTNVCNGRVEVYHNGQWGTVCDDGFDMNDAQVVCRQIGYSAVSVHHQARYGQGSGPIFLDDVDCTGSEAQIGFCRHLGYGTHNCQHYEDVGVVCG